MRKIDMFNQFLSGMDKEMQAQLRYFFTHQMMIDKINSKREREQLKQEIVDEVLARIYLTIDASEVIEKIKELQDEINKLGK